MGSLQTHQAVPSVAPIFSSPIHKPPSQCYPCSLESHTLQSALADAENPRDFMRRVGRRRCSTYPFRIVNGLRLPGQCAQRSVRRFLISQCKMGRRAGVGRGRARQAWQARQGINVHLRIDPSFILEGFFAPPRIYSLTAAASLSRQAAPDDLRRVVSLFYGYPHPC